MIDDLTLTYNGNQLVKVEDTAADPTTNLSMDFRDGANQTIEYLYDANGNQTEDLNKGINKIEYNFLNLPRRVEFDPTGNTKNEYVYSASGAKLAVTHTKPSSEKRTDYVGNMIYENGNLKRILVDGGYIENGQYYFYIQDHLGNNRVVVDKDGAPIQVNHYYPFGASFAEGGVDRNKQPYQYNGKELDTENGLNWYDSDARMYDPVIHRTSTPDLLAENYYSISPYAWVANNPMRYIDPTGMYFDEANEKKAEKIEKKIDKKISKLEKQVIKKARKGKDTGDLNNRIVELRSSRSDISDMRNNNEIEFKYASASSKNNPAGKGHPVADSSGPNEVTLYTERNMGSRLHESRHGGQIARGEFGFDSRGNVTSSFGINSEVSAYGAQYSYDGKLNYLDASNAMNQQIGASGITPPVSTVTDFRAITPGFVKTKIGEIRSTIIGNQKVYGLLPLYNNLP